MGRAKGKMGEFTAKTPYFWEGTSETKGESRGGGESEKTLDDFKHWGIWKKPRPGVNTDNTFNRGSAIQRNTSFRARRGKL